MIGICPKCGKKMSVLFNIWECPTCSCPVNEVDIKKENKKFYKERIAAINFYYDLHFSYEYPFQFDKPGGRCVLSKLEAKKLVHALEFYKDYNYADLVLVWGKNKSCVFFRLRSTNNWIFNINSIKSIIQFYKQFF